MDSTKCTCCKVVLSEIEARGASTCVACRRAVRDFINDTDIGDIEYSIDDTFLDYEGSVVWPDDNDDLPKGLLDD